MSRQATKHDLAIHECPDCGGETALESGPCADCAERASVLGDGDTNYDSNYEDAP